MQPINKSSDVKSVQAAYVARHGALPDGTEGGKYLPSSPLKFAVRAGLVLEYLEALRQATESGKPFDFAAFVQQYNEVSAVGWPAPR